MGAHAYADPEMALDQVPTVIISALVYAAVGALLVGIVLLNLYAIQHAWRSDRPIWAIALSALFLTGMGGGIATAVYLILHHHEPLPASARRRALA